MKSPFTENQQVSPTEKQNLLNKFEVLQLVFTFATNDEDRSVTQQERERSNYVNTRQPIPNPIHYQRNA